MDDLDRETTPRLNADDVKWTPANPLTWLFPPIPDGMTYVRTDCGFMHWWGPPVKEGQRCLCGEKTWR